VPGHELDTTDDRNLRAYDSGGGDATVFWLHGSPQTGALLPPVLTPAAKRGVRVLSYARPGYGGSTPRPGRDVSSAAADLATVADGLGVGRFGVLGASGGGPHAIAAAALLGDRVTGVAAFASPAPFRDDPSWFAGMRSPNGLHAARRGREQRLAFERSAEFDPESFTAADRAALDAEWGPLGADAQAAGQGDPDGMVDDDVAFTTHWGFDLDRVAPPVLIVQGGEDRVVPPHHAQDLLSRLPSSQLWLRPRDGHVSVLRAVPVALDWLLDLSA
jgi:pimeloyl-ACP methyl ester carboxylesterase